MGGIEIALKIHISWQRLIILEALVIIDVA